MTITLNSNELDSVTGYRTPNRQPAIELLTLDDITAITNLSRYHVRDVVVKSPGFPPPAPGTGPRKPRWPAHAVRKFFSGKSVQKANNAG